jgi:hypothetical protein
MKYRLLGKSGLRVSEAALGTMTFGDEWGWGSPKAEAQKVYETYREAGGRLEDFHQMTIATIAVWGLWGRIVFGQVLTYAGIAHPSFKV